MYKFININTIFTSCLIGNAWNTCIQYYPEWKLYVEDILVKYKIPK